ncbi:MAG: 16S rRNA (cytosine(1402)-N(4))-methyltransferase RsmH, partial [Bacilli bacterium]|nr:16S rRNA (cytosine(1402)-N(4))-methyltransferase RsmH [Bacilli bacterium]
MHKSVLLEEVLTHLNLNENSKVIDCTLGYGGHSSEILKRIKKGFLFAFDQDSDAISYSKKKLSKIGNNFEIIKSNFVDIKKYIKEPVDAILYDLGVSSPQLDVKERGFSFHNDAELDMRMDKEQTLSAKEVVNNYSESKLTEILFKYGEEKYAKSIARKIVLKREEKLIETTLELVN